MSGGDLQAFIVKAVIKAETEHTFVRDFKDELTSTPLITLALDKVATSPDDNPNTRIAANCTVYKVIDDVHYGPNKEIKASGEEILEDGSKGLVKVDYDYAVNFTDYAPTKGLIIQGESESYSVGLFVNGEQYGAYFIFEHHLTPTTPNDESIYYDFTQLGDATHNNAFKVKNKKAYKKGKLIVTAKAYDEDDHTRLLATQDYEIKLGGFY